MNSLLATLYISGPPNFLLALCPPNIDPSSLSVMVAFAVGGLLGDTLFHLLPEIFLGEVPEGEVRAVLVEPNKNLLLGVAIMIGFVTFVAMDKGLRIATGGEGHTHEHGHSHESSNGHVSHAASSTGISSKDNASTLRQRKADSSKTDLAKAAVKDDKPSVKLSAYLNIIADFTHNITDGLAMSSSFYASPTIGATTTLAVFCHEIPHEVGDFALLIQGGMSKRVAMGLQFVTALGALILVLKTGWAFQMQDPRVVLVLFALTVALTLNLLGLFELPVIGGSSHVSGGFLTGALAAFVATPCTGPFMAGALGAALVLPTLDVPEERGVRAPAHFGFHPAHGGLLAGGGEGLHDLGNGLVADGLAGFAHRLGPPMPRRGRRRQRTSIKTLR